MTEFNRWVDEISLLTELPQNDKLKKVVSHLIISLPPNVAYVPKRNIANLVKKAAANQVAIECLSLINEREQQNTTQEVN